MNQLMCAGDVEVNCYSDFFKFIWEEVGGWLLARVLPDSGIRNRYLVIRQIYDSVFGAR